MVFTPVFWNRRGGPKPPVPPLGQLFDTGEQSQTHSESGVAEVGPLPPLSDTLSHTEAVAVVNAPIEAQAFADTLTRSETLQKDETFNVAHDQSRAGGWGGSTITDNGVVYPQADGNVQAKLAAGNYTIQANLGVGRTFSSWSVSGGLSVANPNANPTTLTVSGSGVLTLNQT